MYDKSKKTWSQRLKITKTTESNSTTTTSTATESKATTTTATSTRQIEKVAATATTTRLITTTSKLTQDNANNFGHSQVQQFHTLTKTMHLPTLQLSDYHISNGGGNGGAVVEGGSSSTAANGARVGYEYLPSALSRSMKYAEPWIYSTVRGVPARPTYHHFMPQSTSSPNRNYMQPLAVVICSCPEYLNGTKREVKKASVCKKCKGSRLPLTPIGVGGTMRLPASGMFTMSKLPTSGAATVRVISTTKKMRPTILDPQKDPYDLMRRTRLLSPEPGMISGSSSGVGRNAGSSSRDKDKLRGRVKSESPVRGRSRKRGQLPAPVMKAHISSRSSGMADVNDCWLMEDADTLLNVSGAMSSGSGNRTRRSILRCNVNPYDLISINSTSSASPSPTNSCAPNTLTATTRNKLSTHAASIVATSQNEFMPQNDDFNVADAALTEEAPPFAFTTKQAVAQKQQTPKATTVTITSKIESSRSMTLRRDTHIVANVNINEEAASSGSHDTEVRRSKRGYSNVQAIAGQRISLGTGKSTAKSLIKQSENGRASFESIIVAAEETRSTVMAGESNANTVTGKASLEKNATTATTTTVTKRTMSKQLVVKKSVDDKQIKLLDSSTASISLASAQAPKRTTRIRKSEATENTESTKSEAEQQGVTQADNSKSTTLTTPTIIDGERVMLLTVTPTQNIKSILKRPSTAATESGGLELETVDKDQQEINLPSSPSNRKTATPTNQRRTDAKQNGTNSPTTPTAKSQFYIPLPQTRKKVQFRVEERIVHALESDATSSDEAFEVDADEMRELVSDEEAEDDGNSSQTLVDDRSETLKSKSNYEYYNRKREQQRLAGLGSVTNTMMNTNSNLSEGARSISVTLPTLLPTQDTLLAELQKYSDLMTQVIAQASSNNNNSNAYNLVDASNATKSTHYEDINLINIDNNTNSANNSNSSSSSNNNRQSSANENSNSDQIVSLSNMKMLITQQNADSLTHSSTTIKAIKPTSTAIASSSLSSSSTTTTTTAGAETSLIPTTATNAQSLGIRNTASTTVPISSTTAPLLSLVIRHDNNFDDYDDVKNDGVNGQYNLNNNNNNQESNNTENSSDDENDVYVDANDDDNNVGGIGGSSTHMNSSVTLNVHDVVNNNNNSSSSMPIAPITASAVVDDVLKAKLLGAGAQNTQSTKGACDVAARKRGGVEEQSIVVKNANKDEQKQQAIPSRYPIRRSQSERHITRTVAVEGITAKTTANKNNNNNNSENNKNGHQLEDHTTNGDLRFTATVSAARSNSSRQHMNNSNMGRKASNQREEAILSFKDTMALRVKLHRNDSRDLFARPREPPPPPPLTAGTVINAYAGADTAAGAVTSQMTSTATTNTNKQGNNNKAATALATKGEPAVALLNGLATESPTITLRAPTMLLENVKGAHTNKVSTNGLEEQQQEQQKRVGDTLKDTKQTQLITSGCHTDSLQCGMQQMVTQNVHKTNAPQTTKTWETTKYAITTSTPTTTDNSLSPSSLSSSFTSANVHIKINTSPSMQQQEQQRTIVRVAPFNKTKTTSEVHRLKISHTDYNGDNKEQDEAHISPAPTNQASSLHKLSPTSPLKSPTSPRYNFHYNGINGSTYYGSAMAADHTTSKKTSILINGDDCYSTMNLSCDDASTPLYQSSVVVADWSTKMSTAAEEDKKDTTKDSGSSNNYNGLKVHTNTANTVTINVGSSRSSAEELIYQHNKINTMLSRQVAGIAKGGRAIIPIKGSADVNLQRSASSTSSTSTSSMTSISSSDSATGSSATTKRGRTLIKLDYEPEKSTTVLPQETESSVKIATVTETTELQAHEEELLKILRNPVEAVKRNLVPHVCGRNEVVSEQDTIRNLKMKDSSKNKELVRKAPNTACGNKTAKSETTTITEEPLEHVATNDTATNTSKTSFITKLLEDPMLSQVAEGLETETVAELIENSLKRLRETRNGVDISGTKDSDDMNRLINLSLQKIKEERQSANSASNASKSGLTSAAITTSTAVASATSTNALMPTTGATTSNSSATHLTIPTKDEDGLSNRGSISSANSFASANNNYELFDFDANESDCYQSCSSEITSPGDDDLSSATTRSKFYQMLVDATLAEIELSSSMDEDMGSHHYESIRNNGDPIYEEIHDVPPPLPLSAPPINDADLEKKTARSIFEGASKYDILSYLVDAKERGVVREEGFDCPLNSSNPIIIEEEACDTLSELGKRHTIRDLSSRASVVSDSSEDAQSMMSSLSPPTNNFLSSLQPSLLQRNKGASSDIERNDSGVGSETSKSSRSKYQNPLPTVNAQLSKDSPIHLCEDCDGPVETQVTESGIMFAPLVCRKCGKKRVERKEIITEIVETEEKYGRDLQIILEEFCHPMLVAGLLTQEQLSAIFLNTEELLENNQTLAERMRDALDIALEQGDDDLLTVNIGKIFLEFTQMLHAFESYCVRQAGASLLLANLEKEKELLRIFLKVSQMENAVLRRMNLNSFLMVPVQRVTKYPLLLARLYKVTPTHLEGRDQLKQAQEKIELHLNHINQEAKDVPTKLWRRISSSSPNRRASCEIDMINIKLRKMAIDILEWNHDEVRFVMEGKLLFTQPTDSNWKKARTIKLTPVNALLVTNGKPSANYKAEKVMSDKLNFPKHTGIREASLLVVKEKCGRYTLIREPLYLDRCVVCSEADCDDYFEVQEISSKDTFIFKAEDGVRTKQWYTQLQYHAQGMGAWRKRRNALANIMINGMLTRT
ncbi:streptococcal hemagglutinin [Eurosta solidaginis]|uniref:streptococcal hemagglutinin n=1 Tax=Eurosta solidaginis TaxID=178769 RepID=UPI003530C892